jgi:hypothetical protein
LRRRRREAGYLGVKTVCGTPPGVNSVLLPLPLFVRKPCTPLPGTVTVSIDPTSPVTNAGPLDVTIECPNDDGPVNAAGIGEAEPGSKADAWTPAPINKTIAAAPRVLGTMRQLSERVLLMSITFPEFELGSPDDGHFTCSGNRVWLTVPSPDHRAGILRCATRSSRSRLAHGDMHGPNCSRRSEVLRRVQAIGDGLKELLIQCENR